MTTTSTTTTPPAEDPAEEPSRPGGRLARWTYQLHRVTRFAEAVEQVIPAAVAIVDWLGRLPS